jgi:hypothetical protein
VVLDLPWVQEVDVVDPETLKRDMDIFSNGNNDHLAAFWSASQRKIVSMLELQ